MTSQTRSRTRRWSVTPRPPRFRLEFSSLGSAGRQRGSGPPLEVMTEFASLYADYVRRYPSHVPYRLSGGLFGDSGEDPDAEL
jgi:hypothetical protein